MRVEQEKVALFHETMGCPEGDLRHPALIPLEQGRFRCKLIDEELMELRLANEERDLVSVADALADLLYVVLGTAVEFGIDAQRVFDEVHRSNMTKTPLDPATKKGGKGPGYEPPRVAEVLLAQVADAA